MSGLKIKVLNPKQWDYFYKCPSHKASEYMNPESLCYYKDYFMLKFDNPPKMLPTFYEMTITFVQKDPNFKLVQHLVADFLNTKQQDQTFSIEDSQEQFFKKALDASLKNKNIISKDLFFYLLDIFKNAEYETATDEELGIET